MKPFDARNGRLSTRNKGRRAISILRPPSTVSHYPALCCTQKLLALSLHDIYKCETNYIAL